MREQGQQLKRIIEGAILAAGEPLSIARLQSLFDQESVPDKDMLLGALAEIREGCHQRGFDLVEVASGWRFQVREDIATWVNRLWQEKPQKYSRALLETLALIAYRQPLTRGDIEEVRGVAVSSHIIKTLSEREWIKVVGHRDVPGRPALYATTKTFLDYFNLKSLEALPTLGELKDIDDLNQGLEFERRDQDTANVIPFDVGGGPAEVESRPDASVPGAIVDPNLEAGSTVGETGQENRFPGDPGGADAASETGLVGGAERGEGPRE